MNGVFLFSTFVWTLVILAVLSSRCVNGVSAVSTKQPDTVKNNASMRSPDVKDSKNTKDPKPPPLQCYNCHTSASSKSVCEDGYLDLRKAGKMGHGILVKNCSQSANESFCLIEKVSGGGRTLSYIRDCSDGVTFSFKTSQVHRLSAVLPTNQSTCGTNGHTVVCLWLCKGSFCNGPGGATTLWNKRLWMHALILSVLYHVIFC